MEILREFRLVAEQKLSEAGIVQASPKKVSPPASPTPDDGERGNEVFVPIRSGLKNRKHKNSGTSFSSHSESDYGSPPPEISSQLASLLTVTTKPKPKPAEPETPVIEWDDIEEKNGGVVHKLTPADTVEGICVKFSITVTTPLLTHQAQDIRKINKLFKFDQSTMNLRKTLILPVTKQQYYDCTRPKKSAEEEPIDRVELVARFREATEADEAVAITYLQMRSWQLEKALQLLEEDRRRASAEEVPTKYRLEYPDEAELFDRKEAIPTPTNIQKRLEHKDVEVFSL